VVELEEVLDEVGLVEDVLVERRDRRDAERLADECQRLQVEVQRAVPPPPAAEHAAGVGLIGVDDQQRHRVHLVRHPAGLDLRPARLGDGDEQRVMGVRDVLVGPEVGGEQAQPAQPGIEPVPADVVGIAPGHPPVWPSRSEVDVATDPGFGTSLSSGVNADARRQPCAAIQRAMPPETRAGVIWLLIR
jgi:hypothetical protein